jgi:hypothetical protein
VFGDFGVVLAAAAAVVLAVSAVASLVSAAVETNGARL